MRFLSALLLIIAFTAKGVTLTPEFNRHFADSTLRVDYILGGGGTTPPSIMLHSLKKWEGWAGRRHALTKPIYQGNGRIDIIATTTCDTLYSQTFSSLFQEWLTTDEPATTARAFENTFLLPLPRQEAEIRLTLFDNRHEQLAQASLHYSPADFLIPRINSSAQDTTYFHKSGAPEQKIDVAFVAEGYRQEEREKFIADARRIADEILRYEPYASHRDDFNILAVMTPSAESGVTIPSAGIWRDTPFESHFSTFNIKKYLSTPRLHRVHDALKGLPYEHIVILVNTDEYGGAGIYNSYLLTAADNRLTLPVSVHEFGHSFGGLGDEYFYEGAESEQYPLDIEPWEPNITTLCSETPKWDGDMYEGGGYRVHGIYRPAETCRMRDNNYPKFCEVCRQALERLINYYTPPE